MKKLTCALLICFPVVALAAERASSKLSDWTIFITNDSCSDYTWGFDEKQTRQAFADVIRAHLDEMRRTDGERPENRDRYNLSITQEGTVFLEYYPERKQEFLQRLHEGRISVQPFLNNNLWGLQSLESEIRALYGARRLEQQWGISIRTAEHIEEPAMPWGAASILAASGFRWLVVPYLDYDSQFSKLTNPPFFFWEGPDGARIRVLMDVWSSEKASYAQGRYLLQKPQRITEEWLPHYQQPAAHYPLQIVLASGTHSDNGPGSPALAHGFADSIIQYNNQNGVHPKLVNATIPQFLDQVDAAESRQHFLSPVRGDFGQSWDAWPVSLAKTAATMRAGEKSFLATETLLAAASRADPGIRESTRAAHDKAEWDFAMLADHAWNGKDAANRTVNADLRRNWSEELERISAELQKKAWAALGVSETESAVSLFNSLGAPRADLVRVEVPSGVNSVAGIATQASDEDGHRFLYFVSPEMAGFGLRSLKLGAGIGPGDGRLQASKFQLESPAYKLQIDPVTGGIASLIQKSSGSELIVRGPSRQLGETIFFNGQEHRLEHVSSEVVAEGPVFARLKVSGVAEGISVISYVTIYAALDRVDLDIRVHKPVTTDQQRLTQSFPVVRKGATERIETTGAVVRPFPQPEGDLLPGADPARFAVQGFVDVSGPGGPGVTVAPLDAYLLRQDLGPLTFEALGNDQNYQEVTQNQNGNTDFRFRYSLRAHGSDYSGEQAFRWSREVATPILAVLGALPPEAIKSSVKVDPSRAIVTALKIADGAGDILRVWETAGRTGPLVIDVPGYKQATSTDLLERDLKAIPIVQGRITVPLHANGFAAVRLISAPVSSASSKERSAPGQPFQ